MNLTKIIEQLESCDFECEAGPLELNTAFIKLKAVVKAWETLFDAVDDYIYYPSGDNAYPDGHHNPEFLADLRIAFLAVANTLEKQQARAALVGANDFGGLMEPDVDTPFDGWP